MNNTNAVLAPRKRRSTRIHQTRGDLIFNIVITILVAFFAFTALYPFLHVFSVSLSTNDEAFRTGFHFVPIPGQMTIEAYKSLLSARSVWLGYWNTILVTSGGTAMALVVYTLFAYPLARRNLPGRSIFTMILIFTMLFNGGIVPTYITMKNLGLLNTLFVLMCQNVVSAFNILIIRNFFMAIPADLEEAARIDGAGHFTTFYRIVLPLSKPVLTTIALWVAVGHWNSWFAATLYIQDKNLLVLQAVLRNTLILMSNDNASNFFKQAVEGSELGQLQVKSALIMISLIPILIAYPFAYKYFEKGIMIGAVKG